MCERWAAVAGYDGLYEVSNIGGVRSLDRIVALKSGNPSFRKGRRLKPSLSSTGRYRVTLRRNGSQKQVNVHRLVAIAFCPGRRPGYVVCHINGDPQDNRAENLYWGSMRENAQDMLRHGRHMNARKVRCKRGHDFSVENTYVLPSRPNERRCRACRRISDNQRYARRRESCE